MSPLRAVALATCALAGLPPLPPSSPLGTHNAPRSPLGTIVFHNASENYATFRLPTLAVARSHILMFAEGRARDGFVPPVGDTADCYGEGASAADWRCTDKDVVVKRSADGGRSWSAATALALANASFFYTNPQPLFDPARNATWLLYMRCAVVAGGGDAFGNCTTVVQSSSDEGATWGAPRDVGAPQRSSGGFGGVALATGRLVFSAPGNDATGALFSDDGGRSWAFGAPPSPTGGESVLVELSGGDLLVTTRHKNNSRTLARSADGGASWAPATRMAVTDPDCEASLLAVATPSAGRAAFLLFANPHTSGLLPYAAGRQNVTVQRSDDEGARWRPILLVDFGPSAYTALAQIDAATCGVAYEESADLPVDFRSIRFLRFECATGAVGV